MGASQVSSSPTIDRRIEAPMEARGLSSAYFPLDLSISVRVQDIRPVFEGKIAAPFATSRRSEPLALCGNDEIPEV